jgi:hypothetical protein
MHLSKLQEEIMRNTADHSIFAWANESYLKDKLPGLLALKPAHFANAGDIVQSESVAISPFSVTNKGIHLNLRTMTLIIQASASQFLNAIGLVMIETWGFTSNGSLPKVEYSEEFGARGLALWIKHCFHHTFSSKTYLSSRRES